MKVIYSPRHVAHNPAYEWYDGVPRPYAERPARAEVIIDGVSGHELHSPRSFPLMPHTSAIHSMPYIDYLRRWSDELDSGAEILPSNFISDTYTPITAGTFDAARAATDVALTGAQELSAGAPTVYALCRPPGHHAGRAAMGGYCYLNNAAIAAHYLSASGRIAVLDIDFHHGNGTQEIFYDRGDVLYASIHGDPRTTYPYSTGYEDERGRGAGTGLTVNLPLPPGTADGPYLARLAEALGSITDYAPDYLVVSVGFDTVEDDPIGTFALSTPCFAEIGTVIAALGIPSLLVQEGGYNTGKLGRLADLFLGGFGNH